ncbi:class I SAM-dependent methyltransferase [Methanofollis formosanus]|uniref:Class I SAM-dependent methyltransferase n=1 Tax=Methanofollis formosanus TaxID=299308 RepID=A0A8G1EFC9_9EURY|nr:class I SAM-dependent methyltransferase [Methanofollis formosanus]QYZ78031.1 class I SAM-dependent methyltransferase [Methanofollis formosanus]
MDISLICRLFETLPRQGPGNDESTARAFHLIPDLPDRPEILDIGCGSGMQTLALAQLCPDARITAVDIHRPVLDALEERARRAGVADRIRTICASMDDFPFENHSFDLIWAEGSIFIIGFEKGLSYWQEFLKDGGYIALTEAAWFTPAPSPEAKAFWAEVYPAIRTEEEYRAVIAACGLGLVGSFRLPEAAWWDDFYRPLETRLEEFAAEYAGNPEAMELVEGVKREIAVYRDHAAEYGYIFFVMRKISGPPGI